MKKLVACILVVFVVLGMGMSAQAAPEEVKGKVLKEVPYKDNRGDNVVILSRSDRDGDTRSSDLYAYGYANDGASHSLSWKMYDYIHECPVDLTADFSGQSPIITDLDKNGISEIWLVYYIGCRGDVSPDTMKIIMYEGNKNTPCAAKPIWPLTAWKWVASTRLTRLLIRPRRPFANMPTNCGRNTKNATHQRMQPLLLTNPARTPSCCIRPGEAFAYS